LEKKLKYSSINARAQYYLRLYLVWFSQLSFI